eukprot:NODE_1244_length_940_cov_194.500615_g1198_i0.p1 GENE.NODE_1244_length_940_cov_194.500615_g1198_i0~~NODE_1244_length_940_cov_194.500615_g1198_i0.p1  ORF type:complete len:233 (-),score=41.03 NODE_1244_length_940_cov_194.500615_g1198_i0:148-846(-)
METGESVYNLIPKPKETVVKPEMYRSRFHQQAATVPPSCSTFGLHGRNKITSNDSGQESTVPRKGPQQRDRTVRKGPTTKKTEKPVMGLVTDKNFVTANAVEATHTVPTKRPPLESLAAQSTSFGTVPKYLKRVKAEVGAEREFFESLHRAHEGQGQADRMGPLTDAERAELITGLKKKWEEVHKQYQKLTFNIDTGAKVQRKEGLEVEMEHIEKSIQKLSKKNIFVYDDTY